MTEVTAALRWPCRAWPGTPASVCASGPAAGAWFLWLAAAGHACLR